MQEHRIYTKKDEHCAAARLRRCICLMTGILLVVAALYVLATVRRQRIGMLAALIAFFCLALLMGDLLLLPRLRYHNFLKNMNRGLRRSTECTVTEIDSQIRMEDGAQVRAMHVCLRENGDSRIFYVNAAKAEELPGEGMQVRLESWGRHVVSWERL